MEYALSAEHLSVTDLRLRRNSSVTAQKRCQWSSGVWMARLVGRLGLM